VPSSNNPPRSGAGFEWTATALAATFTGGLFLDGWAHTHGQLDETFFTPFHAALYGGFFAMTLLLVGRAAWGVARHGLPWRRAMPDGYGLALAGVAFWLVGGPFDALWHEIFGFEANIEALMSPAHAVLAVGIALMASGPFRSALRDPRRDGWRNLTMLLSLTLLVSILTFFTQIAHPVSHLFAAEPTSAMPPALGIVGILFTSAILTAPLVFLLRHGRMPAGATALVVGLNAVAMGFLYWRGPYPSAVVGALVAAAILIDAVRVVVRPAPERPRAFRSFAVVLAATPVAAYFVTLAATTGITWTTHVWVGVVVFTAAVGWLLSYLVLPPRLD
jgi:hypothetical protein